MFLGHLCPIDEYRVYGYMTSTRLKLLAVLEDVNDIREPELKRVRKEGKKALKLVEGALFELFVSCQGPCRIRITECSSYRVPAMLRC